MPAKYSLVCPTCSRTFETRDPRQSYCSRQCFATRNRHSGGLTCPVCGTRFYRPPAARDGQRYCSYACLYRRREVRGPAPLHERTCAWCGAVFLTDRVTSRHPRFCGRPCFGAWQSATQRGPLANGWKGGLTERNRGVRFLGPYKAWRAAVFARDNHRCQSCGCTEPALHAHHLLPVAQYPTLTHILANGLTLCRACHNAYHHEGRALQLPLGVGVPTALAARPVPRAVRRHPRGKPGEQNPNAQLTDDAVRAMRRRRAGGEIYRTIAADHGIAISTVAGICTGRMWRHVED